MMIPNKPAVCVRFLMAAVVAFAGLVHPAGARAQQPSDDRSEGVTGPMAATVAASAAVAPTVSMSHEFTGVVQETFRLDIRFSQSVTGFALDDIQVTFATPVPPLVGSGRFYSVTMNTNANHHGSVFVTIPGLVAHNAANEGNIGRNYAFEVDNQAPDLHPTLRPRVDRDELILTYTEDLDERFVPSVTDYAVSYIRDGRFDRADVTEVEVVASEVFLILADRIRFGDRVELFYDDGGPDAIRDRVGNFAPGMLQQAVRNNTRELVGEAPSPPLNLTASADGASVIVLDWDAPADTGSSAIVGYRIEVSNTGTSWRTLEPDTRNTETTYRHTGLEANTTRHYRVSAINADQEGNPSDPASATTGGLRPNAPRRFTARARSASAIELDWAAPLFSGSAGAITGYVIEVSTRQTGGWSVLANTRATTRSYTHPGLSPGTTRYYRVAALNREGQGDWSRVVSATTDADAPDAPTGLSAVPSGVGGRNAILLRWTRPTSDGGSQITGYRIEESPNGVSGWTALETNTGSAATTYTRTGLLPATTRHYRVAAINAEGTGGFSNVASATTNAGTPTAPQSLRARADGPRSITLSWDVPLRDNGSTITGYAIQVRGPTNPNSIIVSDDTESTATTFQHTNLQPVSGYSYRVAAINSVGAGPWSPVASTTTHADVPSAPPTVSAQAVSTSQINLSWAVPRSTGGAPILGYRVEASSDGGNTWRIIVVNSGSTARAFIHRNLQPGATWSYRVSAINTAGVGPASGVTRATTFAVPPGAPTSLRATPGGFGGRTEIVLTWSAPSSDGGSPITGYRIEVSTRRTTGWTPLEANTGNAGTTYTHTGRDPGTTLYYRVAAINARGRGAFSTAATGTTNAGPPAAPTNLRANADGPTTITIAWDAPDDNGARITGYRVRVRLLAQADWTTVTNNTGSPATVFQHPNLQPATSYRYQVAAINSDGAGPWSAEAGT
ncbi:MAG: fibronectin type III domain-containing protein, partial [Gemmatimonadota bacterium]|nr:fibronectin type III domain-containing protein [Gemmatimonadota bacterium]